MVGFSPCARLLRWLLLPASVISSPRPKPVPPVPGGDPSPPCLPTFLCQTLAPFHCFLKAAHVNAQSIYGHIDEFVSIFENSNFDLILISETWLKPHISNKSVELHNYSLFRNDRLHKGGGGVAIYAKSHLPTSVLHMSDSSLEGRPEYLFLDVNLSGTHVLVGVCYRAPKLNHIHEFESVLLDLLARYSHVLVMGDFNIDLLGPITHDQTYLTTMMHSCNLTILPLDATHHTPTTDTFLDIMAVSDPSLVTHHGQVPAPGLSKHDLIFLVYDLRPPKNNPKIIRFRDFKQMDINSVLHDASLLPWNDVVATDDVNSMVSRFNELILGIFDKHAPIVTKRVTKGPAPWLTPDIKNLQKQRDSVFRKAKRTKLVEDWDSYKKLRNRTQQQIRNAKIRFYYKTLSKHQSSKALWTKLKNLDIGKSKIDSPISLDLNTINNFFTNIPVDSSGARDYVTELEAAPVAAPAHQFSFTPVTEDDVLRAVMRMTSSAVGADKIPICFIKYTLPITLPTITFMFNKSLSSSTFPNLWKSAIVRPLHKIPSPQTPSDFRPISILSALSKCLERVVYQQFLSFLETNKLLSKVQSGFRSNHGTATALLKITDDVRSAMDKSHLTILTLFDFSKAFDCVYHPLLFFKLKKDGFSDGCVNWVKSYLTGRTQLVRAGVQESHWRPVTRGVPQGSVLGPLLFSFYIDSVTNVITHSKFHLYADDLQIYYHFPVKDIENSVALINLDIKSITVWATKHGLKLNESKTQTIVIGHPRLLFKIDPSLIPKLKLNDHELSYSDKVKNLGLIFNRSLTWNDTVTATCNRVFACVHSLKRFALFLPFNIKVMLVKTLVLPHFNYCDSVTNDMTVELSDRLQRAQNYCIRFIFNLRYGDHVTPYYDLLSLLKLKVLREYHILSLLHTILTTNTPAYLSESFIFMSQFNSHSTRRGNLLLSIPPHRTSVFSKSFVVTACRLWNSLPDNIKRIEGRARFGTEVRGWLARR